MKKQIIIKIIGIGVVLATIGVCFFIIKTFPHKENNNQSIKVVNIDKVISAPDNYKGFLGVEGTVIKIDEDKGIFLLGCGDACTSMPVKYTGQMPKLNSEIMVYGEIKKQADGRYIFQQRSREVKTR